MTATGEIVPREAHAWRDAPRAALVRKYLHPAELLDTDVEHAGVDANHGSGEPLWWMVYTKSRQEKKLSQQLCEMGVPHFLPVHQREAITRGKARTVEQPLFAGYLFLCCEDEQRRVALTTNRISTTQPITEPQRLRHDLTQIARSIAVGAPLTLEARMEPGDWARVKSGLYAGLEGVVLRRQGQTNLLLSVNFLKQGASLELPDCLLEPIDAPLFDEPSAIEIVGRRGL